MVRVLACRNILITVGLLLVCTGPAAAPRKAARADRRIPRCDPGPWGRPIREPIHGVLFQHLSTELGGRRWGEPLP